MPVLFDIADGWGDKHRAGAPVVVVTHSEPEGPAERWPTREFVGGVEAALTRAREIAGLVDEVCLSLAPVRLLEDPVVVQGRRALRLRYPVRR
jgi:hypothetical protein